MCCLFDLNRTTKPEDTVILFTFKSDSLPNRRPSPLLEPGLFSLSSSRGLRRNSGNGGDEASVFGKE